MLTGRVLALAVALLAARSHAFLAPPSPTPELMSPENLATVAPEGFAIINPGTDGADLENVLRLEDEDRRVMPVVVAERVGDLVLVRAARKLSLGTWRLYDRRERLGTWTVVAKLPVPEFSGRPTFDSFEFFRHYESGQIHGAVLRDAQINGGAGWVRVRLTFRSRSRERLEAVWPDGALHLRELPVDEKVTITLWPIGSAGKRGRPVTLTLKTPAGAVPREGH